MNELWQILPEFPGEQEAKCSQIEFCKKYAPAELVNPVEMDWFSQSKPIINV
jgi:hypothetical protein